VGAKKKSSAGVSKGKAAQKTKRAVPAKRSAGTQRAATPKARRRVAPKVAPKSLAGAKAKPARKPLASAATSSKAGRTAAAIDPRVVAAIEIALEREAAFEARSAEVTASPSAWTLTARARRGTTTR
jgi:hypothetical protein